MAKAGEQREPRMSKKLTLSQHNSQSDTLNSFSFSSSYIYLMLLILLPSWNTTDIELVTYIEQVELKPLSEYLKNLRP